MNKEDAMHSGVTFDMNWRATEHEVSFLIHIADKEYWATVQWSVLEDPIGQPKTTRPSVEWIGRTDDIPEETEFVPIFERTLPPVTE